MLITRKKLAGPFLQKLFVGLILDLVIIVDHLYGDYV